VELKLQSVERLVLVEDFLLSVQQLPIAMVNSGLCVSLLETGNMNSFMYYTVMCNRMSRVSLNQGTYTCSYEASEPIYWQIFTV
jgi:hypothetical protein